MKREKLSIDEVIDALRGTCEDIDADEYSADELLKLDGEIFQCATCGWWCDIDEYNAVDEVCDDCVEDADAVN